MGSRRSRSTAPSFAASFGDRRRARAPSGPVLRDVRLPGAVPRRLEGGLVPRDPVRRARARPGAVGALRPAGRPDRVPRPRRRSIPTLLDELVALWWAEAERNQVLPLDNRPFSDLVFGRTPSVAPRARYRYWPGRAPVPESVAVNVKGRPHAITAHLTVGAGDEPACGVLAVQGSVLGGWSFHLLADGRLCYVHNLAGWRSYRVEADVGRLAPGDHTLAFRFDPPHGELLVDDAVVGAGDIPRTIWSKFSITGAGLTAGWSPDLLPGRRGLPGPVRVHRRHPPPRRHRCRR